VYKLTGFQTNLRPKYLIAQIGQMVFAYDGHELMIATYADLDDPVKKERSRALRRETAALSQVQAWSHATARELVRRVRTAESKPVQKRRPRSRRKNTRRRVGQGRVVLHQPVVP
jgi:hypothetical protein